jgi:hypothetical protein
MLFLVSISVCLYFLKPLNKGRTVYHASAGKKTIGTARPGNNSGFLICKGNETEMGMITKAKEIMENKKLKTISPLPFNR